jgi:hypothetical protein
MSEIDKSVVTHTIKFKVVQEGSEFIKGKRRADMDAIGPEIEKACEQYEEKGYQLFQMLPITRGEHSMDTSVGGWGVSVTEGVVLVFKKI